STRTPPSRENRPRPARGAPKTAKRPAGGGDGGDDAAAAGRRARKAWAWQWRRRKARVSLWGWKAKRHEPSRMPRVITRRPTCRPGRTRASPWKGRLAAISTPISAMRTWRLPTPPRGPMMVTAMADGVAAVAGAAVDAIAARKATLG